MSALKSALNKALLSGLLAASVLAWAPAARAEGDAPISAKTAVTAAPKKAQKEAPVPYGDYLAARSAQLDHDWKTAGRLMRQVWETDRENDDLRRSALLFSLAGGQYAPAVAIAKLVPTDAGEYPLAQMVQAIDDLAEGRFDAAAKRLAQIPQQGVNRYLVPLLTAWSEVGQGHKEAALAALAPIAAMKGSGELHDLQAAMVSDAIGDRATAGMLYAKLIAGKPSVQVLFQAIGFHQRGGAFDEARKLVELIDADGPGAGRRAAAMALIDVKVKSGSAPNAKTGAAAALFEISASLAQQQDQPEAVLDSALYVQMAIRLRPLYPDAQLLVAQTQERFGRLEEAAQALMLVDPTSDLRSTAVHQAMLDLARAKQYEPALKIGREAAKAHPGDFGLALDFGDVLRNQKHYPDAVAVYSDVLKRLPEKSGRRGMALFARGAAYERTLDWPKAEADLQAALQLRPNDAELLNYLAFAWVDRNVNLDRAHTMLERAIQITPNNGAYIDSLGWLQFRKGNYADAVRQLERAVELDADDATVADHLGDAYWKLGRQREAQAQWERASRLTQDKDLAEQLRVKLRDGLALTNSPGRRGVTAE